MASCAERELACDWTQTPVTCSLTQIYPMRMHVCREGGDGHGRSNKIKATVTDDDDDDDDDDNQR